MLLAEYMNDSQYSYLRNEILCFSFGDRYGIMLRLGKTIDFPDLEDILDVMTSEFKNARETATICFSQQQWGRAGAKVPRNLIVSAVSRDEQGEDIVDIAMKVRRAVTMYNLTQSWDQFLQSNL